MEFISKAPNDKYGSNMYKTKIKMPDIPDEWDIGIIYGPSGTGKTTILKNIGDISKFNEMSGKVYKNIPEELLIAVSLMSIPAWYTNIENLSGGERERLNIANILSNANDDEIIILDEFTSFVDRATAKGMSKGISNWCRSSNKRLIIATIHNDIFSFIRPDWIWSTRKQNMIEYDKNYELNITYNKGSRLDWHEFEQYHYLSNKILPSSDITLSYVDNEKAGFIAIEPQISGGKRVHRLVVFPEYQGLGIGKSLLEYVANIEDEKGYELYIKTSHPAMGKYLEKSDIWSPTSHNLKARKNKGSELWDLREDKCYCYKYNRREEIREVIINKWSCLSLKGKIIQSNDKFIYKRKNHPTLRFNTYEEAEYEQHISSRDSGCNEYKIKNGYVIIKINDIKIEIKEKYLDCILNKTWYYIQGRNIFTNSNKKRVYLKNLCNYRLIE